MLLVTLKDVKHGETVGMSCVSCSHVFNFRVRMGEKPPVASTVRSPFEKDNMEDIFGSLFGNFGKRPF